jgi:hypothetical protein
LIVKEDLKTEELKTKDEEMTKFLKERFGFYRELIKYEVQWLKPDYHINVAFYRDGTVKIKSIKNGDSARTYECISSVVLTQDRDVDEWVNYAIENRVYRL